MQTLEMQQSIQSPTKLHTLSGLRLEQTNFTRPKPLLLLAYLCLEGKQEKRFLAELFWQGASNHLNSLAKALSQLRQVGVIDNDDTYAWATVPNDITEFFEALERKDFENAVTLYQSSFLSGFYLPDWGVELEEWVYSTREYLVARMREALLELAEKSDDTTTAMKYAERAYELMATLEPDLLPRLYKFLANTPHATKLKQEAEEYGIELLEKEQPKTITSNLPSRGTSFIGRDIERLELGELLSQPDVRLLTIVGQGGVGKTRLALEVAREAKEEFRDGVVFIALESLLTVEQAMANLSSIFSVQLNQCDDAIKIAEIIQDKQLLLLFDNFEHLIHIAPSLSIVLQKCPNLKILITSRARLELEEEWIYGLEGFSLPEKMSLEVAQLNDTVTLFVQRARKVKQGFTLTQECLPFVLDICKRVEGLPLGIELAASWAKTLSCAEIAENLEDLDFLVTSLSNVSERQQSLGMVFEGSWNLLSKEEQNVLGKLSVFRGGFTSEAARKIANASLLMLARLVDKSLLRVSNGRYGQHPLLRTFTEEKLEEQLDEQVGTRAAHASYFLALAEEAEPHLTTAQQVVWLDRLDAELDNLRSALEWFFIQKDEVECGLRLASGLLRFWLDHSRVNEGRNWLEEGLARSKNKSSFYAKFRHAAGTLARRQGDFASAHTHLEASLLASRGANDKVREAKTLGNLAYTIAEEGDLETAERYMRQSLEIYQTLKDEWGIAITLGNLANILCDQGNYKAGRRLYEQCLSLLRELKDDLRIVGTLTGLGLVALDEGDYVSARAYAEEALALQRHLGDRDKISLSLLLTVLGRVAYAESDYARALTLFQESLTLRSQHGEKPGIVLSLEDIARVIRRDDPLRATSLWSSVEKFRHELSFPRPPVESNRYEVELEKIKMVLEDEAFTSAWVKGQVIGLEQAVNLALQHEL